MKRRLLFRRWPGRFGLLFLDCDRAFVDCDPLPVSPTRSDARPGSHRPSSRRERGARTNAAPDSRHPGDGTGRSHGDHGSGARAHTVSDPRHLRRPSKPWCGQPRRRRPCPHRFRHPDIEATVQAMVRAIIEASRTSNAHEHPHADPHTGSDGYSRSDRNVRADSGRSSR